MANPILAKRPDKSIKEAIAKAVKDRKITFSEVSAIMEAALDGGVLSDLEYRELNRFLRKESRLSFWDHFLIESFISINYPLEGPFIYSGNIDDLEGAPMVGTHQCAALVQTTQPIGLTSTWRQGLPVRDNGVLIKKGTAVATFEDGFYPNRAHDNHIAYYLDQDSRGVDVMDQWSGKGAISSRKMLFKGKKSDGLYKDPSNNGDALSVIMRKK
jgi:hypothetical protein